MDANRNRGGSTACGSEAGLPHQATWSLSVSLEPASRDCDTIHRELAAVTEPVTGSTVPRPVAVLLRDHSGRTIGGLRGRFIYRWLMIDMLFVPEGLRGRGIGTGIVREAERAAREAGCIGVQVSSFEFQAPGFYRRLGYSVASVLPDFPPGSACVHLIKRLG